MCSPQGSLKNEKKVLIQFYKLFFLDVLGFECLIQEKLSRDTKHIGIN
jgi:hypothetical protein